MSRAHTQQSNGRKHGSVLGLLHTTTAPALFRSTFFLSNNV